MFTIKLNNPVMSKQNSSYTIVHEAEMSKRFYENMLLNDVNEISVHFSFNLYDNVNEPHLYLISHNDREKKLINLNSSARIRTTTQLKWVLPTGAFKKDILRIEW